MATDENAGFLSKLFELRMIVAVLFGVYGVACLV